MARQTKAVMAKSYRVADFETQVSGEVLSKIREEWEPDVRNEIQGYLDTIQETEELAECYRRERDKLIVERNIYRERLNSLEDRLIAKFYQGEIQEISLVNKGTQQEGE